MLSKSYFTGKQFSTFLLAVSSSKVLRGDENNNDDYCNNSQLMITTKSITKELLNRCTTFLDSINAPNKMKSLLSDRLYDTIANTSKNWIITTMKQISEWCAFLDYCERTPLRLSEDLGFKQPDDTVHPLWLVGYGTFGVAKSNAILSVPSESWSPELYFLADKWMGDYVQANPKLKSFFDLGEIDNGYIGSSAAVMSWGDPEYLKLMHNYDYSHHDIGAGFIVYHKYPIEEPNEENHCYLNWLPKSYCELSMVAVRRALGESKLAWMVDNTEVSRINQMLLWFCTFMKY